MTVRNCSIFKIRMASKTRKLYVFEIRMVSKTINFSIEIRTVTKFVFLFLFVNKGPFV